MTDEQIKQNAKEYAHHQMDWSRTRSNENPFIAWKEGFEDGAHSRDEEIEELKDEIESLKENEKELFEDFKKRGTKLGELMKENVKLRNDNKDLEQALACAEDVVDIQRKELKQLRNPWISVEERLPEKWKRIKVHSGTGEACWAWVSKTVFVNAEGWDNDPEKAFYDFDSRIWWSEYGDNIENLFGAPECWMPIPELKKGE